jgi:hypothetical protein
MVMIVMVMVMVMVVMVMVVVMVVMVVVMVVMVVVVMVVVVILWWCLGHDLFLLIRCHRGSNSEMGSEDPFDGTTIFVVMENGNFFMTLET